METINHFLNITATVVSPLSVGQGREKDWVEGIDYIRHEGQLYHLSMEYMVKSGINMDMLSNMMADKRVEEIKRFLRNRLEDVYDFGLEMPVRTDNPVKTFYFNPITEQYILFGSSLKGAIRSALFNVFTRDSVVSRNLPGSKLDESVFGSMRDGTAFTRFIRISDFCYEETELVNTKVYNLQLSGTKWIGGWKCGKRETSTRLNPERFNTVYECLMPGAQAQGRIMISPLLYERVVSEGTYKEKKDQFMSSPRIAMINAINTCTEAYLSKEIAFFREYDQGEGSDKILASLEKYHKMVSGFLQVENPSECLVKMAAGTGFHMITGDWQFDDYTDTGFNDKGKKKYKSRKIACMNETFTPMGFIKLSVNNL